MSILTVENVNHGFGARKILEEASFRLLKGEHVALVGANGEGKSTFLNIITGKLMPDEGKVEWCNRITTGYLDQHTALTRGKTIRDILREAFVHMFDLEKSMPKLPVARLLWKPLPSLSKSAEAWIMAGGAHHTYFSFKVTSEQLCDWAVMMGMECLVIDKNTDLRSFNNELRWNEAAWR